MFFAADGHATGARTQPQPALLLLSSHCACVCVVMRGFKLSLPP